MLKAMREDARRLMHDGAIALSRVEENGIRIDVDLLDKTIGKVKRRIDKLSGRLKSSEEWGEWRKLYGSKASLGSRPQLTKVLREMGHRLSGGKTRSGQRQKADKGTLEKLDLPFVKAFLEVEKLKKLHGTYLLGIRREVVDGLLHPFFNLHTVRTYRSSSDRPNFQNIPIRDKMIGKLIRQCFVPRDGNVLVEIDFGQLEVRVAACYHRDPTMIEYIETGYDMHREMAAKLFLIEKEDVEKDVRYCAKNMFVFPQFYGSWFGACSASLWGAIGKMKLKVRGVSLREHLAEQGIEKLGKVKSLWGTGRNKKETGQIKTERMSFVHHVRDVEDEFWELFSVYKEWKEEWWQKYLKRGWFEMLTGFREQGIYKRNDVINHPVQGSAFHCLLWCLIELVKWTGREKMGTKIVGQIHDSVLADVPVGELDEYVGKARELMTSDIRRVWDWIVVPLDVDVAVCEENWFEKGELVA